MKRLKTLFVAAALIVTLAGNIFAASSIVSVAVLPVSFASYAVGQLLSLFGADDHCPVRQCSDCRPNNGADGGDDDGGGNCRPPAS